MLRSIFTVGGTVQAGLGRYLSRPADDELLSLCEAGEFAYVLTARQMGKSSLMVRTAERLAEKGVRSVIVDLSQVGVRVTPDEWHLGILTAIEDSLDLDTDVYEWWGRNAHLGLSQRLTRFCQEVVLREIPERVVVFFDEIDSTLSLDFTDDFFAAIRFMYNARSATPEFERLSFVLVGVATPSDLISDRTRTPFNIGRRVDVGYFKLDNALPLAEGFNRGPEKDKQILQWVLSWTGGHPYLTQRLSYVVANAADKDVDKETVDRLVSETFLGEKSDQDSNLRFVRDMLTVRAPDVSEVLTVYRSVLSGRQVSDDRQSQPAAHLKLSGVVTSKAGALQISNAIYATVFDQGWLRRQWPEHWIRRVPPAVIGLVAASFIVIVLLGLTLMESQRRSQAQEYGRELSGINVQLEGAVAQKDSLNQALAEEFRLTDSLRLQTEAANAQLGRQLAVTEGLRSEEARLNASLSSSNRDKDSLLGAVQVANANLADQIEESDSLRTIAERNLDEARESRRETITIALASKSVRMLSLGDPALGALLARQAFAFSHGHSSEFLDPIYDALRQSLNEVASGALSGGPRTVVRHDGGVRDVAYSPDGRWLASAGDDGQVGLASVSGPAGPPRVFAAHRGGVRSVAFSPDGSRLLTCGEDGHVKIWSDIASDGPRSDVISRHDGSVWSCVFSRDGTLVASGSYSGEVRVGSLSSGSYNLIAQTGWDSHVRTLRFVEGTDIIAIGGDDGVLGLWPYRSTSAGMRRVDTGHGRLMSIAQAPGREVIATGGTDRRVRVWPLAGDGTLREPCVLAGHEGTVNDVAFSADGRKLATASADRSVRLWDRCDGPADPPVILQDHTSWVWAVALPPEGDALASGSEDRTARLWRTGLAQMAEDVCDAVGDRSLTRDEWQEHVGVDFSFDSEYAGCDGTNEFRSISSAGPGPGGEPE